jgi:hypothetical protein
MDGFGFYKHLSIHALVPCLKRDLLQCQKRPTIVSKETYYSVWSLALHTSIPPCIHACMHACMHACIHVYMHASTCERASERESAQDLGGGFREVQGLG